MNIIRRSTLGPRLGALIALAGGVQLAHAGCRRRWPAVGKADDGHRDFTDGSGGLRHRPDRDRDCRWRDAVGRRTDGVRTARLHDRAGGIGAGLRGSRCLRAHSASTRRWCNYADHRQAERNRDPPVGKPTEPDSRRRSRTGAHRDAHRYQPRVQFGELVGNRPERCVLGRSSGGPSTHGEGRSTAPADLCPAHPVQGVLSRQERTCFRAACRYPRNWR